MKKVPVLLTLLISLTLCACSDSSTSSAPAATSAPDTSVSSSVSSETESSSEAESIVQDSSETDKGDSSLTDEELERLSNISENFETPDDFLDSVYVKQYYNEREPGDIIYIPSCDDDVVLNGITAFYGCYYIYYTYNDKTMGICVDMMSGSYSSAEQIYNEMYDRLSCTLRDDKDEILSHYKYDKENDMMICDEKTDTSIGYISVRNNVGFRTEIFASDMSSSVDDIIEFSKHLHFDKQG